MNLVALLGAAATETEWMRAARCRDQDPNLWFPHDGDLGPALAVCRECPVRVECLEYALRHRIDYGVWGGVSERKPRRIPENRRIERWAV